MDPGPGRIVDMHRLHILLVACLVLVAGCTPGRDVSETVEGQRLAVVVADLAQGRSVQLVQAMQDRATELGMTVDVLDSAGDEDRQKDLVAQAVDDGVAGIMLVPIGFLGYEGVVTKADEAGVFVAVAGTPIAVQGRTAAHIGPDPVEVGRLQMEQAVQAIDGQGRIAILSVTNRTDLQRDVQAAYDDVLAEHPDVETVFVQPANGSPSQAQRMVAGWLRQDPELRAVVAMDDDMAIGALTAIAEAGRDDVAVIGAGGQDRVLSALLGGAPGGTVWTSPWEAGRVAVDVMAALVLGEEPDVTTALEPEWVDSQNVHEYLVE